MVTEALSSVPIHFSILKLKFLCYPECFPMTAGASWQSSVSTRGRCLKCCPWGSHSLRRARPACCGCSALVKSWWFSSVQFSQGRCGLRPGRAATHHLTATSQPHRLIMQPRPAFRSQNSIFSSNIIKTGRGAPGSTSLSHLSGIKSSRYKTASLQPATSQSTQYYIIYIYICPSSCILIFKVRE